MSNLPLSHPSVFPESIRLFSFSNTSVSSVICPVMSSDILHFTSVWTPQGDFPGCSSVQRRHSLLMCTSLKCLYSQLNRQSSVYRKNVLKKCLWTSVLQIASSTHRHYLLCLCKNTNTILTVHLTLTTVVSRDKSRSKGKNKCIKIRNRKINI